MSFADSFKKVIFSINDQNFESYALELFSYQFSSSDLYRNYCRLLKKSPDNVSKLEHIPFLPITFFKNHAIKSGKWKEEKIFMSSGTTQSGRSRHYVRDLSFYLQTAEIGFKKKYGSLSDYQILALLPSYQEQGNSSLIAMIDDFMKKAKRGSSYFLYDTQTLLEQMNEVSGKKILIGVSYALLDFAEKEPQNASNTLIMETGGMKGRRKEITREELHNSLKGVFGKESIHSEYGMTELFSQAYGENGNFQFPNWAQVMIRDINDPFAYLEHGSTGGINIIDLANVDTCAFIETKDLGRSDGNLFQILGRFDNSDIRGCNLMF